MDICIFCRWPEMFNMVVVHLGYLLHKGLLKGGEAPHSLLKFWKAFKGLKTPLPISWGN